MAATNNKSRWDQYLAEDAPDSFTIMPGDEAEHVLLVEDQDGDRIAIEFSDEGKAALEREVTNAL